VEVFFGVSADHCGGAVEYLDMCGAWSLCIPALGKPCMVQPGLPFSVWTGAQMPHLRIGQPELPATQRLQWLRMGMYVPLALP
jgi:hypothetical protein